jgi:hypothetical protein
MVTRFQVANHVTLDGYSYFRDHNCDEPSPEAVIKRVLSALNATE